MPPVGDRASKLGGPDGRNPRLSRRRPRPAAHAAAPEPLLTVVDLFRPLTHRGARWGKTRVSAAPPRAPGLMLRRASLFERSSISLDRSRNEVRVESEWES